MKKRILTLAYGGNNRRSGRGTIGNVASWMLVSVANCIDHHFVDTLVIGDRRIILGVSINTFPTEKKSYPFIYLDDGTFPSRDCTQLDKDLVKGKIVLFLSSYGLEPLFVGAKGTVMLDNDMFDYLYSFPLSTFPFGYSERKKFMEYIDKTNKVQLSS